MKKKLQIKYIKDLLELLPIKSTKIFNNEIIIVVGSKKIKPILYFFKNHLNSQYKVLSSISGVDYPEKKNRFEISYEILSIKYNTRLRKKTYVNEILTIHSIVNIYSSAN